MSEMTIFRQIRTSFFERQSRISELRQLIHLSG
jgi:hypothetical protein